MWLLGVPLIDTVTSMLRRMLKGSSPFKPDREHFHHILQLAGFSPRATLGIMFGVSASMAAAGLGAHYAGVPEWVMFYAFLALFALHFLLMRRAWRVMRFIKRSLDRRHLPDRRQHDDPNYNGVERRSGMDRRVGP